MPYADALVASRSLLRKPWIMSSKSDAWLPFIVKASPEEAALFLAAYFASASKQMGWAETRLAVEVSLHSTPLTGVPVVAGKRRAMAAATTIRMARARFIAKVRRLVVLGWEDLNG